jgi:hypothetical protein
MFQTAKIFSGIVHKISIFSVTGNLQLLDDRLENVYFFIGIKDDPRRIVINNRIDGAWGKELDLPCSDFVQDKGVSLEFKFDGFKMEVWNEYAAESFAPFDNQAAELVGLSKMQKCINPNKSLLFSVVTPDVMDVEINYQVLRNKLENFEARLASIEGDK